MLSFNINPRIRVSLRKSNKPLKEKLSFRTKLVKMIINKAIPFISQANSITLKSILERPNSVLKWMELAF